MSITRFNRTILAASVSSVTLSFLILNVPIAQAAILTQLNLPENGYRIKGELDSGPIQTKYTGNFKLDESSQTETDLGDIFVDVTEFNLRMKPSPWVSTPFYSQFNLNTEGVVGNVGALFTQGGRFLGIQYAVEDVEISSYDRQGNVLENKTLSFSINPGFIGVEDYRESDWFTVEGSSFFYNTEQGAGSGSVEYHRVPEPLTILGSAAALGFGGLFQRKKSQKKNKVA